MFSKKKNYQIFELSIATPRYHNRYTFLRVCLEHTATKSRLQTHHQLRLCPQFFLLIKKLLKLIFYKAKSNFLPAAIGGTGISLTSFPIAKTTGLSPCVIITILCLPFSFGKADMDLAISCTLVVLN